MKKFFIFLSAIIMFFSMAGFASEAEYEVIHDLVDFKIVAEKYPVTTPRGQKIYMYNNYGVIDKNSNVIVEQKYQGILPHSEGRAAFVLDGKIGFFDENWNVCIDAKYYCNQVPFSDILFSEGLAAVPKKDETK